MLGSVGGEAEVPVAGALEGEIEGKQLGGLIGGQLGDEISDTVALDSTQGEGGQICTPNETNLNGWPGNDPSQAPDGTEWRGRPGSVPGDSDGNYYNATTGESYRPDLDHPQPIGPHWDYKDPNGQWWRIYPGGGMDPK